MSKTFDNKPLHKTYVETHTRPHHLSRPDIGAVFSMLSLTVT